MTRKRIIRNPRLIDPADYVVVRAVCMAGGVELHELQDCPKDETCPVWVSIHPNEKGTEK